MADICMLVEGAYPYVSGGVSSWLHALVTNLPDITFDLTHIGTQQNSTRERKYRLPDNIATLREIYLHDYALRPRQTRRQTALTDAWRQFFALHQAIARQEPFDAQRFAQAVRQVGYAGLSLTDLLVADESWQTLTDFYAEHAADQSFVDFFWTFRLTYLPLFALLEAQIPAAPVYHTVSTGFSGLLGVLGKIRHGGKLIVTEHGIYTREREIEIMQSAWIYQPEQQRAPSRLGFFQEWWLNLFRFMERLTYEWADTVISITGVNQRYQRRQGVAPAKLRLIPNGVNTARLRELPAKQDAERFVVGFVGRVVSIKDVKTFIRAIKVASERIPNLDVLIVGPTDEEPRYFAECQRLVAMLDLGSIILFTGPADVMAYYPRFDVLALTSLSEGQPLVILEGNGAGVPVVASDVGACRELLEGATPDDQALGASGVITPVASPEKTANALVQLWRNPDLRQRMGAVGRQRVERFYRQEALYDTYRALYHDYLAEEA